MTAVSTVDWMADSKAYSKAERMVSVLVHLLGAVWAVLLVVSLVRQLRTAGNIQIAKWTMHPFPNSAVKNILP